LKKKEKEKNRKRKTCANNAIATKPSVASAGETQADIVAGGGKATIIVSGSTKVFHY